MDAVVRTAIIGLFFYIISSLLLINQCDSSAGRPKPNVSSPFDENDLVMFDDDVQEVDDVNDLDSNSTHEEVVRDFTTKDFNEECLKSHNELRKSVGVPPLRISKKVRQSSGVRLVAVFHMSN